MKMAFNRTILVFFAAVLAFSTSLAFANSDMTTLRLKPLQGKKILFDSAHGQNSGDNDWLIDTSYSSWADKLEDLGAEINAIVGPWDRRVIVDFDVLVIPEPQTPFTQNEISAIIELLSGGKGVFILTDGAGEDENNDGMDSPSVVNTILHQVGISCDSNSISGNPLRINTNSNCPFISGNVSVSCWEGATYSGDITPAISTGNKTFIGYAEVNDGRLVVCGDSEMFGDGTGTPGDKLYDDYKIGSHRDLSESIIKYLSFVETEDDSNNDGNDDGNDDSGAADDAYEHYYAQMNGLTNDAFLDALKGVISGHVSYSYSDARKFMYSKLDNHNGTVDCVYSFHNASASTSPSGINCEHTWPQSKFSSPEEGTKKTDVFHLYPTKVAVNSMRGSYPFGNVVNVKKTFDDSKLGSNNKGATVFEPPDEHKGNVARSMFYFSTRYGQTISAMQEDVLREWNKLDPVDDWEKRRNNMIYEFQHNRNPFIDHPEFADRIADF